MEPGRAMDGSLCTTERLDATTTYLRWSKALRLGFLEKDRDEMRRVHLQQPLKGAIKCSPRLEVLGIQLIKIESPGGAKDIQYRADFDVECLLPLRGS